MAVCDARDLGGPFEAAALRRLLRCFWPPGWVGRSAPRSPPVSGHRGRCDYVLAGLLGLLAVLAALSSGRQVFQEHLAVAGLPPPPSAARNVVLIVWDTVRAYDLSAYGYARNTTPNLARWAARASGIA